MARDYIVRVNLSCDGSEVVVRFSPFSEEGLTANAEQTHVIDTRDGTHPPRYGVSVVAGRCEDGETFEEAVARIAGESTLNGKTIAVMLGSQLRDAGLDLVSDPVPTVKRHYLVGEAPFQAMPNISALASLVEHGRMRNPGWKKGRAA